MPIRNARLRLCRKAMIGLAMAVVLVDLVWVSLVPFALDGPAYLTLAAISTALLAASWFYDRVRHDDGLTAMLFGAGFLVGFSAAFGTLNYLLLTVAGARIDPLLAAIDQSLGFDWPAVMAFAADRPGATFVLKLSYNAVLPQIPLLLIALASYGQPLKIYEFCTAYALAAIVTVGFWAFFPSFGAFTSYQLPADVTARLDLAVDGNYVHALVPLLTNGPGLITPGELKGLVAFPSFHSVLAVLIAWYARDLRYVAFPAIALNIAVLAATPIHGSHYGIDVLAGVVLAGLAVAAVRWLFVWAGAEAAAQSSGRQSIGTWPGRDATRPSQARISG